jgi:hypothetical protein
VRLAEQTFSAVTYASIEAAMMFGPRGLAVVLAAPPLAADRAAARCVTVTTPIVSVPSPSAWMS